MRKMMMERRLTIRAVEKGNKDIVELLIQKGADINLGDRYRGAPLCHAALNGEEKIVDLLFLKMVLILTR